MTQKLNELWLPEVVAVMAAVERGQARLAEPLAHVWEAEGLYNRSGGLTRKGHRVLELFRALADILDVDI